MSRFLVCCCMLWGALNAAWADESPLHKNNWALTPVLSFQQLNGTPIGYDLDLIFSHLGDPAAAWVLELGYIDRYDQQVGYVIGSDIFSLDAQHSLVLSAGLATPQSISWLEQFGVDYYLPSLWGSESYLGYHFKTYSDLASHTMIYAADWSWSDQVIVQSKVGAAYNSGVRFNSVDTMLGMALKWEYVSGAFIRPYYAHGSTSYELSGATPGIASFTSDYVGITLSWIRAGIYRFGLTAELEVRSDQSWASALIFQNRIYW